MLTICAPSALACHLHTATAAMSGPALPSAAILSALAIAFTLSTLWSKS
jgi:hypothetical protein